MQVLVFMCLQDVRFLQNKVPGKHLPYHYAGVYGPKAERGEGVEEFIPGLESVDKKAWQEVLEINTIAPLMLTRALLPCIEQGAGKKVLFISSMLGSIEGNNLGGGYMYNSSKAALNMVGKSLSVDLLDKGITVAMAHPGWVKTEMGGPNAEITAKQSAEGLRAIIDKMELGSTGRFWNYDCTEMAW
ncbi:SDR family NAD(P)-dependent oxidoreductase [Endozoicomonas sp. Mp262]|uniref:SDR family NAD(P)-dependent oxidoreductase n=1 Tax=Endozoicomonas sp. Mp262 TaxID=2919499 RepID=UPI0021D7FCAE